jgi:hypothetical protein
MKQLSSTIFFAVLYFTILLSAQNLCADNLNECLLEALKNAEASVTVGQLREQCQPDSGTSSVAPPSQANSSVISHTNIMSENGPAEVIMKTSQGKKPAYFPHEKHQRKYTCGACHHGKNSSGKLVKYTSKTIIEKCTACHDSSMPNKELNSYKLIGHELCRECHRKNQNITSAKCSTCHR